MRLILLNQYEPPDPSPTAKLTGELADALRKDGHQVTLVGSSLNYRVRARGRAARLFRELRALAELFWKVLSAGKADVILSTSSPPGLLVIATFLSVLKRAKSVHWALDLYPELALALDSAVPKWLEPTLYSVVRLCYRAAAKVVCLERDMQDHIRRFYGVESEIIQPWLLYPLDSIHSAALNYPSNEPFVWLYSGNLGRAHEWETLLDAQRILEDRGRNITLIFQGDGPARPMAEKVATKLGLKQVQWRNYAPQDQLADSLLGANAMVVTQKPSTQGLIWPSKLGLVMCLPRPIVFVGPVESSIADSLRQRGSSACFSPGDSKSLAAYMEELYLSWPPADEPALKPGWTFSSAYKDWARILNANCSRKPWNTQR
jgi:colanic acid biosynthesis glycosyl transferase WcaI